MDPKELEHLGGHELAALAAQWRTRALHGDRHANGVAHELEREVRRRNGALSTQGSQLESPKHQKSPWWAFWLK